MARLPKDGEYDWGKVLGEYLKQSLDEQGNLVSGPINPHTGKANTNLASRSQAGLIRLAGDLSNNAASPQVTGLQGSPVSPQTPTHGQTLAWNARTGMWEPSNNILAQAMAISSMRI
jgi:hypothetical protein